MEPVDEGTSEPVVPDGSSRDVFWPAAASLVRMMLDASGELGPTETRPLPQPEATMPTTATPRKNVSVTIDARCHTARTSTPSVRFLRPSLSILIRSPPRRYLLASPFQARLRAAGAHKPLDGDRRKRQLAAADACLGQSEPK